MGACLLLFTVKSVTYFGIDNNKVCRSETPQAGEKFFSNYMLCLRTYLCSAAEQCSTSHITSI